MDKPLWGLRVDGPSGRRFLRGLSLTRPTAVRVQRLWCPGSEGSEGSACLWQAGSKGGGIALRAMSFIARLAGTGLHWRPPPPPLRGPPPPASGGRQGLRAWSSPPCYLPTPFPGVGGEHSETEGGGRMGHSVARVLRVQRVVVSPWGNAYKVSVTVLTGFLSFL